MMGGAKHGKLWPTSQWRVPARTRVGLRSCRSLGELGCSRKRPLSTATPSFFQQIRPKNKPREINGLEESFWRGEDERSALSWIRLLSAAATVATPALGMP